MQEHEEGEINRLTIERRKTECNNKYLFGRNEQETSK